MCPLPITANSISSVTDVVIAIFLIVILFSVEMLGISGMLH
jgi:hypothetical protein